MNDLRLAILNNQPTKDNSEKSLEILRSSNSDWHERYWACKYILQFDNLDSSKDKIIIDNLEKCIEDGLSFNKDSEIFIDAIKNLAQLCFKYNDLKRANNYLVLFRDLSDEEIPFWVYNYLSKILFKLDLLTVILNPKEFFILINKALSLQKDSDQIQTISILKELFNTLLEFFKSNLSYQHHLFHFLTLSEQNLKPILIKVQDEWQNLVAFSSERVSNLLLENPNEHIDDLNLTFIRLKSILDSYKTKIESLTEENLSYLNKINRLEEQLDEKELQFREQLKEVLCR